MKLPDAWSKLDKALTRLEKAGKGRVARMNARKSVLTTLRQLRESIDEEYPTVAKKSKTKKRKTPVQGWEWRKRLRAKGWIDLGESGLVPCLKNKLPHKQVSGRETWAPKWVAMAFYERKTTSQLRKIAKSRTEQKALTTLYVATQGGRG